MTRKTQVVENSDNRKWKMSRRQFLVGLGSGLGLLAVGTFLGRKTIVREVRLVANQVFLSGEAPTDPPPEDPTIWFEIDADNIAHIYIPKTEMGQGIHTSLAQIAADELEVEWDNVRVHQADTSQGFAPGAMFTFGSTTITGLYQPIREVAANMREMLRAEAATQLNVDIADIQAELSYCFSKSNPEMRLSYGELVANRQGEWEVPENDAPLKAVSDFRYIGQSVGRVDFYDKVTGRAPYGYDARLPGMLYGAVARPPRYGATLTRASAGDAESQPGVVAVVIQDGFAGIVAETRFQAYAALSSLDLQWDGGSRMNQADLEEFIRIKEGDEAILIQREGNVSSIFDSGNIVQAEYRTAMAANAHLEPRSALVDIDGDSVTIYTATQAPGIAQRDVAEALGLDAENVTVVPMYLGGSFGAKSGGEVSVEAAILARAVGRPVNVGWNRTEEMLYGSRRPPTHHILSGAVDDAGNLIAMEHQVASGDVLFALDGGGFLGNFLGTDPLAAFGSLIQYDTSNRRVLYHRRQMEIPTGFWRGLGSFPNIFAMEAFMDEMAHTANIDPLQFRLNHLPEDELGERMRVALEEVRQASDWDNLASDSVGRGIALTYDRNTVVALVMTVTIENNRIRPLQAWCAVDPGFVVNPDGASAQVQGQIVMGLSSTLYERVTIEDGMVENRNFSQYPLLTMRDTPSIEVLTINSGDTPIGGLGEPVIGAVPAAMSNAVFNLNGQRLRELPFQLA